MTNIRTTNKRRKRRTRKSAPSSAKVHFEAAPKLSKRAAVDLSADEQLNADGRAPPHDPDGVMESYYNYSAISMPGFLLGVEERLRRRNYTFTWNQAFVMNALQDKLRPLKARIAGATS